MSYAEFFKLTDSPFRLTPDPQYYFPSQGHSEALETLIYAIRAGEGFVQITGPPGTGKTLLIRTLLQRLEVKYTLALILSPTCSPRELLVMILEDLGVIDEHGAKELSKERLLRLFRTALIERAKAGDRTIIVIDEAQNLPMESLEELRMLSNLETDTDKLLQIILAGQPQLARTLASPDLSQLAQRITIRYRLQPFKRQESGAYIRHRLERAGQAHTIRFGLGVLTCIHRLAKGVPRLLNIICERALMAAFVEHSTVIRFKHLSQALTSIRGQESFLPLGWRLLPFGVPLLACGLLLLLVMLLPQARQGQAGHKQEAMPPVRLELDTIQPDWQSQLTINQHYTK